MDEQSTAAQSGGSDGFSSILNGILSNPEMMAMISSMAGKLKSENAPAESEAAEASEAAATATLKARQRPRLSPPRAQALPQPRAERGDRLHYQIFKYCRSAQESFLGRRDLWRWL